MSGIRNDDLGNVGGAQPLGEPEPIQKATGEEKLDSASQVWGKTAPGTTTPPNPSQPSALSETALQEKYNDLLKSVEDLTKQVDESKGKLSKCKLTAKQMANLSDVSKLKKKPREIVEKLRQHEDKLTAAKVEKKIAQAQLKSVSPEFYHGTKIDDLKNRFKDEKLGKMIHNTRSTLSSEDQVDFDKALMRTCSKDPSLLMNYRNALPENAVSKFDDTVIEHFSDTKLLNDSLLEGIIKDDDGKVREGALSFVQSVVKHEVSHSEANTIFRGATFATKLFTKFNMTAGKHIPTNIFNDNNVKACWNDYKANIAEILKESPSDPKQEVLNNLAQGNPKTLDSCTKYMKALLSACAKTLQDDESASVVSLFKTLDAAYPNKEALKEAPPFSVTQLFLRFINPSLAAPQLAGLPADSAGDKAEGVRTARVLMAKVAQNLANGNPFSTEKESGMTVFNSVLEQLSLNDLKNIFA